MKYGLSTNTPQLARSKAEQVSAGWDGCPVGNSQPVNQKQQYGNIPGLPEGRVEVSPPGDTLSFFLFLTPPAPAHKGLIATPPTDLPSLVSLPF